MNKIQFWYPARRSPSDDAPRRMESSIRVINTEPEPYEVIINSNGCGFHAIFGSQINGNFLCIPNWGFGCELGPYEDRFWNISSIASHDILRYEDACAIGNALELISLLLGKVLSD